MASPFMSLMAAIKSDSTIILLLPLSLLHCRPIRITNTSALVMEHDPNSFANPKITNNSINLCFCVAGHEQAKHPLMLRDPFPKDDSEKLKPPFVFWSRFSFASTNRPG